MNNKNSKTAIGIAIVFEFIALSNIIFKIISKDFYNIHLLFILSISITLPFLITYISNKKNLLLPSSFQIISLSFILLAQYFGEYLQFYTTFAWWDLFLHGSFGFYMVIIALHLFQGIITYKKGITKKRFIIFSAIFAFAFTMTLGTLWEIFEFLGDYFLKTDMTTGGLEDTITDLMIKAALAFITAMIYSYNKIKKLKEQ